MSLEYKMVFFYCKRYSKESLFFVFQLIAGPQQSVCESQSQVMPRTEDKLREINIDLNNERPSC